MVNQSPDLSERSKEHFGIVPGQKTDQSIRTLQYFSVFLFWIYFTRWSDAMLLIGAAPYSIVHEFTAGFKPAEKKIGESVSRKLDRLWEMVEKISKIQSPFRQFSSNANVNVCPKPSDPEILRIYPWLHVFSRTIPLCYAIPMPSSCHPNAVTVPCPCHTCAIRCRPRAIHFSSMPSHAVHAIHAVSYAIRAIRCRNGNV